MNRRNFVMSSAVAAAGIGVAGFAIAGASEAGTVGAVLGRRPYKVIFDTRFEASCSFATGAVRLGCPTQAITGDVTALWFNELQPRWARGEGAIIGMTTGVSLFCLEQLAWDQWKRVVARVEHRSGPDDTVRHRLFVHQAMVPEIRTALSGNALWSERLVAPLVKRLSVESVGRSVESVVVTHDPLRAYPGMSLVSWVIAA